MHLKASMSSVAYFNSKNLGCCFQDDDDEDDDDDPDGNFLYMDDIEAELSATHGLEPLPSSVQKPRDMKQTRQRQSASGPPALDRFRLTSTLAKLTPTSEKSSSEGNVVLPVSASLPLVTGLMNLSMDVQSIQSDTVSTSLQASANKMVLEEIIHRYDNLSGQILSQNFALQLFLDLLFVRSSLISSPSEYEVKVTGLIDAIRLRIDPDNLDVMEPYLEDRVKSLCDVLPGLSSLVLPDNIGDQDVPGNVDLDTDIVSGGHCDAPLNIGDGEQETEALSSVPAAPDLALSPLLPSVTDTESLLSLHHLGEGVGLDAGDVLLHPPGVSHSQGDDMLDKLGEAEERLCLSPPDGCIVIPDTPYCPHPPTHPEYRLFMYPKPRVKNSVALRTTDFKTLDHKTWINCGIINFYTQYLFYETLSREDQDRVLIYESEFLLLCGFNDGTVKMIERYKNIKIFEKNFLFFPVCENNHWILIVCVRYIPLEPHELPFKFPLKTPLNCK